MRYDYPALKDVIQGWWREHKGKDQTNGLDDLMEVVKEVYHKDLTDKKEKSIFVGGRTTGTIPVSTVEFYADNFVALRRAYLLTDDELEDVLETGFYTGAVRLAVGLDGFVLVEKENKITVSEAGGPSHGVKGVSDFPAHAARISLKPPEGYRGNAVETLFDGSLHLGYFINDRLAWVGKNIAIYDHGPETLTRTRVYVESPRFLAAGIIDRRTKC